MSLRQSSGAAENAVRKIEAKISSLKFSLEERYGMYIPSDHHIVPWLANHAAFCVILLEVGHDGETPFQRVRGKPFDRHVCEIGENIFALNPKESNEVHRNKLDSDGLMLYVWGFGA